MSEAMGACPSVAELEAVAALEWSPGNQTDGGVIQAHLERCAACREWVKNARFEQEFAAAASAKEFARDLVEPVRPELPGYEIVREISRGAQGIVYEAVQVRTRRRVALKILRQDHGVQRSQRARFEREIEIAAALHHPGIVAVYDSIALPNARHALVLEFVEGRSLDRIVAEGVSGKDQSKRCAELVGQVCEAIHYAHQRGVIHRDLKPSNILVDAVGKPRILDFGVACWSGASAIDSARITLTGEFAGTLAYAAPEQVMGDRGPPDLRSDLYAIGVILYQMCVGDLPYGVRGSLDTVIRNIASATPARPTRENLDSDLWIIISKALAKEPDRRYQSGDAMASDLRRYVRGEAIEARKASPLYVLRKSVSRHRYVATGIAVALTALAIAGAMLKAQNTRLAEALRKSNIEHGRALGAAGSRSEAESLLWPEMVRFEDGLKNPEKAMFGGSPDERRAFWAGAELQASQPCLGAATLTVTRANDFWWEADRVLMIANDGVVRGWSLPDFRAIPERRLCEDSIHEARVAGKGRRCVTRTGAEVRCIDLDNGDILGRMSIGPDRLAMMAVSESGTALAIWRPGEVVEVFALPSFARLLRVGEGIPLHRPWFSASGDRVAIARGDGSVCLYQLPSGELQTERQVFPRDWIGSSQQAVPEPWSLSLTGTGNVIAVGKRRHVFVCDSREATAPTALLATVGNVVGVAFSPSGRWMLSGSIQDSRVHVRRAPAWEETGSLPGHTNGMRTMSIAPDERYIVSVDAENILRLWAGPDSGWTRELPESTVVPHDFDLNPKTGELWAACSDGTVAKWRFDSPQNPAQIRVDPRSAFSVAYSPEIGVLGAGGEEGTISVFRNGGEPILKFEVCAGVPLMDLRFSPDGRYLAACAKSGQVVMYETKTWTRVQSFDPGMGRLATVRWSPDGKSVAVSGGNGMCAVLSTPDFRILKQWKAHWGQCRTAIFSVDGDMLATGGDDGVVRLWETGSWRLRGEVPIGKDHIFCLAFHEGGQVLAVGDRSGRVTQVGVPEAARLASFQVGGPVMAMRFVGSRLIVGSLDQPIEVWDFAMLARCARGASEFWKGRLERAGLDR